MKEIFMRVLLIILCLCMVLPLSADDNKDKIGELALKGIDLATTLHYAEADSLFEEIVKLEPANPCGYFLRSATYFWMFSEDIKNETVGDKFRDLSYQAADIAEARLDEKPDDLDAKFFLGGAYGSLGRYYAMTKSYLNAYWYGKKGKNYLEEVIEADSTYYDAYLGLGIYHYLADVLPRFIKILSFVLGVDGDKAQGIKELKIAAEKGFYTKTEAMFFLGAIYTYRENEFEKAIKIFNELLQRYPDNPGALLSLGRCYSNMGECNKAVAAFEKVLQIEDGQSRLPRGSIYYQLGDAYFRKNEFVRARDNYLQAIASDSAEVGKRRWIYPRAQLKLATCYELLGDIEKARYYLKQVSEEDSEHAYEEAQKRLNEQLSEIDSRLIRADNLKECGQFQKAYAILSAIEADYSDKNDVKTKKKLESAAYQKAEILYEQKRYAEAVSKFKAIIDQPGEKSESRMYWTYFYLGNSYKALGEYEKAKEAYDKAEGTDSDRLLEKIEHERQQLP